MSSIFYILKGQPDLTYNASTSQMGVTRIKPTVIVDSANSAGTASQYLASNGSSLTWKNKPYIYAFSTANFTPSANNTAQIFPFNTSGTISLSNEFSASLAGNRITYTGTATRKFLITVMLQAGLASTGTIGVGFEVRKNNVLIPGSSRSEYARFQNAAGDSKPHMVSQSIVEMATNNYIEAYCATDNISGFVNSQAFASFTTTGINTAPTCIMIAEAID